MKNSIFWFILLGFWLVLVNTIGLTIHLRIALIANAIVLIIDTAKTIRRMYNE